MYDIVTYRYGPKAPPQRQSSGRISGGGAIRQSNFEALDKLYRNYKDKYADAVEQVRQLQREIADLQDQVRNRNNSVRKVASLETKVTWLQQKLEHLRKTTQQSPDIPVIDTPAPLERQGSVVSQKGSRATSSAGNGNLPQLPPSRGFSGILSQALAQGASSSGTSQAGASQNDDLMEQQNGPGAGPFRQKPTYILSDYTPGDWQLWRPYREEKGTRNPPKTQRKLYNSDLENINLKLKNEQSAQKFFQELAQINKPERGLQTYLVDTFAKNIKKYKPEVQTANTPTPEQNGSVASRLRPRT